ncbi:hypothetical protein LTR36_006136 [Oleoguttula mirabilis]|uniref:TEA domain-containing protein n=1 Tax=Oleoguttula mirabilis TaxID=1507867 RepID=A0AAV9JCN4_9PEZI|nr:hypothetical protein LTR36_006136 [Oleoguttula mirabilis]
MIQPARVLPSNAPPLRDGDGVHQASRVLQEHSGNRQQNEYPTPTNGYEQKYPTPVLTENALPTYQQPQSYGAQLYQPQPQYRQTFGYGQGRPGHGFYHGNDDSWCIKQARYLYRRFQNSSAYMKYRGRQRKDDKGNDDQKWPDHLEEAFFRALVKYPPMGRRKQLHKDKQRGRNELIADHIQELTGEARTRKQVSSHIQVLKPFVEHDTQIMKWLSKDDMGAQPHGGRHGSGYGGGGYMSGRRMSTYPAVGPPNATRGPLPQHPQTELSTVRKLKHNLDMFEPTKFEMFVQRKYESPSGEPQEDRLHTYTQAVDNPLGPDIHMQDWQSFNQEYAYLASMHTDKPLDCNVLVADASLGFPVNEFRGEDGSPLPGIELGISFVCSSRHLSPSARVRCRNSFFRNGHLLPESTGASGIFDVPFQVSEDGRSIAPLIKFGSNFWASTLASLATKLKKPTDAGRDPRDEVRDLVRGITAVQEVVVSAQNSHERILVMFWTFRLSSVTTGRASWRRLVLPPTGEYPEPKAEQIDSVYDYGTQYVEIPATSQPVALQSPFEYDSSSASALSSATWPTSVSDGSINAQLNGNNDFSADNSFDFNGGNINLAFDPNLANLDFSNFDSSAFDFDATVDYAQDPALDQYSQQWCDSYSNGFDGQAPLSAVSAENVFAPPAQMEGPSQTYNGYDAHFDQQIYGGDHDTQAYGGAGQDGLRHDDDALAALADASFIAQSLATGQAVQ